MIGRFMYWTFLSFYVVCDGASAHLLGLLLTMLCKIGCKHGPHCQSHPYTFIDSKTLTVSSVKISASRISSSSFCNAKVKSLIFFMTIRMKMIAKTTSNVLILLYQT